MKVSIIIPNYNGEKFVKDCFESLKKQTEQAFDIIMVDNRSSDNSVEMTREICGDFFGERLRIIKLDDNYGFSKAVNVGIKASEAPYVILLNNDTEVDSHFVEEMLKGIRKSKKIFSCASKMIQFGDRSKIDSAGDYYTILGCTFTKGYGKNPDDYNKVENIFSSCAGAAIYRRKLFEKIGYFDEMHFAYLEDVDVGYRALINGYKNVFLPKAIVYHVGSGSSGSRHNEFKVKLAARNNVYLNYKNMPLLQLVINYPFIIAGKIMKLCFMSKKGLGMAYIKGVIEGYKGIMQCKKVEFKKSNILNYIYIEIMLVLNLIKKAR